MKRDLDLVRYTLLCTEAADEAVELGDMTEYGCDTEAAAFHIELMAAHGLIDAKVFRASGGKAVRGQVYGLTWDGYDYLDAVRSDTVWTRAKRRLADTVGTATFKVVVELCEAVAREALGI